MLSYLEKLHVERMAVASIPLYYLWVEEGDLEKVTNIF